MEYGSRKKGILHTNCTNPMLNVILCEMEEKDMSYTLLDRFEFFNVSNCIYLLISFFKKKKWCTYRLDWYNSDLSLKISRMDSLKKENMWLKE